MNTKKILLKSATLAARILTNVLRVDVISTVCCLAYQPKVPK